MALDFSSSHTRLMVENLYFRRNAWVRNFSFSLTLLPKEKGETSCKRIPEKAFSLAP
jgi:hypothetical protein